MRQILIFTVLLLGTAHIWAQCGSAPVFTKQPVVASDETGQSLTFTATTDSATDFMPMWGSEIGLLGSGTVVYDTVGVTSHSVTIRGFWPNTTYGWALRVRKIVGGLPCPRTEWVFSANAKVTTLPPPAGGYDYWLALDSALGTSPHHVTQGYGLFLKLQDGLLIGKPVVSGVKFIISGLPPHTAIHWPDRELWGENGAISTTAVENDTYAPLLAGINGGEEVQLVTNVGGTTPTGNYTLTFTGSDNGRGASVPTHSTTWAVSVDSPRFAYGSPSVFPAVPDLATWQANMLTYGARWCFQTGTPYEGHVWYYDGTRVFYQISNYTGNGSFPALCGNGRSCRPSDCVASVNADYRNYVLGRNVPGSVPGFRSFTQGLSMDFLHTGDQRSRTAAISLEENGAFSVASRGQMVDLSLQRETAFRLDAERYGEKLGSPGHSNQPPSVWISYVASHVIGQLDQICLSRNAGYWESFMVGLQMEALIKYYEDGHQSDVRVPQLVKSCAEYLYADYWNVVPDNPGAFSYDKHFVTSGQLISTSKNGVGPTAILNMLIAPAYAWLYSKTGTPAYLKEGDAIWDAGVMVDGRSTMGWAGNGGKQFSQSYRWSFDYVKYRSAPVVPVHAPQNETR